MRSGNPGPDRPRADAAKGPDLTLFLTKIMPSYAVFFLFRCGEALLEFGALCLLVRRGARLLPARAVSSASISHVARCQWSSCLPCGCPSASQSA
jgi:hypothetical protein